MSYEAAKTLAALEERDRERQDERLLRVLRLVPEPRPVLYAHDGNCDDAALD